MKKKKHGLTLIEFLIVIAMFSVIAGVTVYVFQVILRSWTGMEDRTSVSIVLNRAVEEVVRDVREATQVSLVNNDEIRFTKDDTNFYIYYLYNSDDSYPPAFNQDFYELRKATLSGGINGTFTYGSGKVIIIGVVPPSVTDLSFDGSIVTLDLSVTENDETVRIKTDVTPRNL